MMQAECSFNLNHPLCRAVSRPPVLSSPPHFYPFDYGLDASAAQLQVHINDIKMPWDQIAGASAAHVASILPWAENQIARDRTVAATASCTLEEFATARANNRASKLVKLFTTDQSAFELEDLKGCYVEFSKDQHGSRFLQKELEVVDSDMIQVVFEEVLPVARNLMIDVYGNYVIQKFFDFGTDEQRLLLANKLQGSVVPLSLHLYGCRVVQKGLETLPGYLQAHIMTELQEHAIDCIKDQHGNHVIQKCFTATPPRLMQLLINPLLESSFEVATHPFGCRVVQRMLENCSEPQVDQILTELLQFTELLIQHQYGNYIIQHVMENGKSFYKSQVINSVRGKVFLFALQKHASNVLEKCLTNGSQAEIAGIVEELCEQDSNILPLMKDQYGNYVIQKALDIATPNQKRLLIYKISPHLGAAHKYMYAKHIISKVERYLTRPK